MIFFINGASSSGKTALARALQVKWQVVADAPLLYLSLDSVISQFPFAHTGAGVFAAAGFPRADGPRVAVGVVGHKLNLLAAQYARSLAESGFVGLSCATEELSKRELERGDRALGLAAAQQTAVLFCASRYDLELDSTRQTSPELAERVLAHFAQAPGRIGFKPD